MTEPAVDPSSATPPIVSDALRVQILATEHWSLLATRSMTWNEIFTRAGMFLTTLSAAVVALALVAQATAFGETFRTFAFVVLPAVLLLGIGTLVRLGDALREDVILLAGMNRLRHAYLELAPDLEPYFITGHHDDMVSIMRPFGHDPRIDPLQLIASTPVIVAIIDSMIAGTLVAIVLQAVGGGALIYVGAGVLAALVTAGLLAVVVPYRQITRVRTTYQPHFPDEP